MLLTSVHSTAVIAFMGTTNKKENPSLAVAEISNSASLND
jgi:hypothetical protein